MNFATQQDCYLALQRGKIVAFSTDTVAGLAVDSSNAAALKRLFALKKRPIDKKIVWLVPSVQHVQPLLHFSEDIMALTTYFWPGELTLVLNKKAKVMGCAGTQGVRIPAHKGLLAFLGGFDGILAVTSANISGEPSCKGVAGVADAFQAEIASGGIVCANVDVMGVRKPAGNPSMVLDVTGDSWNVLRPAGLLSGLLFQKKLLYGKVSDKNGEMTAKNTHEHEKNRVNVNVFAPEMRNAGRLLQKIMQKFPTRFLYKE